MYRKPEKDKAKVQGEYPKRPSIKIARKIVFKIKKLFLVIE